MDLTDSSLDQEKEKTEVWRGHEDIVNSALARMDLITTSEDVCCDSQGIRSLVLLEPVKYRYYKMKQKGVTIRFITEVTKENIVYCKEVMNFAELRHISGVKGNFGVHDNREYTAMANFVGKNSFLIYSNVKEIVEQHEYLFDMLWDKAIPAEQRIMEIEEGIPIETTEIWQGLATINARGQEVLSKIRQSYDLCIERNGLEMILSIDALRAAYADLKRRGIKIRIITDITTSNILSCKELLVLTGADIRHLGGVKGNITIADGGQYGATARVTSQPPYVEQFIHCTIRTFVDQQQYFFETLWNKAIPAEQRIREIEGGVKPEVIETIRDPNETQERVFELLKSAKEEILIIFSTSNAFRRQEKAGGLDLLWDVAKSKGLKVRILSPVDDYIRNIIDRVKREYNSKIEIRNIEEPLQTKVSVLIVDRASMLTAELKSDSKQTVIEAIGLATYSNSKATVLSYASIFESLWNQTELYEQTSHLYEQLKSDDKMKQEFMDIAAHELRTPLQPILGLSQILKEQISDSAQINFVDVILRNAKRLQRLQQEMLDVTRIESGTMKIHKERFDLNDLVIDVLQDFESQLKDNDSIKLNHRSDADVWVNADKHSITQVIANLLDNAIKFTKAGRILVKVTKRMGRKNTDHEQAIVSVKDEGTGLDPSIIPRLFTKFATKSQKGTGLGLFISKSIIEAHGGEIWAENNTEGGGATFVFTLPIHEAHQEWQTKS